MGEDTDPLESGPLAETDADNATLARRGSMRAAVALEDAGELRAAARLFEEVGEQAQAAALRLEHASTLRSDQARLRILREGAARIDGDSPEGRELHQALARALVQQAAGEGPGARRRAIVLEAAQSYVCADQGERAGQIYERLGLLKRAELAYRDAGAIEAYERVLAVLEARAQAQIDLRERAQEIDDSLREGQRQQARALMQAQLEESRAQTGVALPRAAEQSNEKIARDLAQLERAMPRGGQVCIRVQQGATTHDLRIVTAPAMRIGRSPGLELVVDAPAVSRHHLVLRIDSANRNHARIFAEDLGSRAGSFFDGEALAPGTPEPLDVEGELSIGIAAAWQWIPNRPSGEVNDEGDQGAPSGLLGPLSHPNDWLLFAPAGGQLSIGIGPRLEIPLSVRSAGDFLELEAATNVRMNLRGRPLGPGASIQPLVGDHITLSFDGAHLELEILRAQVSS